MRPRSHSGLVTLMAFKVIPRAKLMNIILDDKAYGHDLIVA